MPNDRRSDAREHRGILMRLLRDRRGNVLAISAGALIPLIGFSGSAFDMARLYIVKVRLQQACDAGVLAGRRVMTDTSMNTPLESSASTQAQAFFANNFRTGYLRSTAIEFKPAKAAVSPDPTVGNAVTATATATVPLAIMGYFKLKPVKIDVACQAVFDMADTDVMFVLDTTGSMSCLPSDPANCAGPIAKYTRKDGSLGWANTEKDGSKIDGLRDAVILFDDTMRANADKSTRVRYGFVTYSSGVNVGKIIPPAYLQRTDWTYQSRQLSPDTPNVPKAIAGDYPFGNAVSVSLTGVPRAQCVTQRSPVSGFARTGYTWNDQGYYQARSYYNLSWSAANGGTCSGTQQPLRPRWRYGPVSYPIDQWATGGEVVNPSRLDGSKSKWTGCIEELDTTPASSFDVTNLPDDLNPDVKPSDNDNKWRPQWPDVVWNRATFGTQDVDDDDIVEYGSSRDWPQNVPAPYYSRNYGPGRYYDDTGSAPCGMPARTLQVWTAQQVKDYVNDNDFRAYGGTYHDIGMIWGTRMLSPDGIYEATNTPPPGRNQPTRNIVFMTDGAMAPNQFSYGQYGVELWDNRTGGQNDTARDTANHNARFRVECDAAKRKGFTIYVVALGTAITNDLTYCASPGQTYQASSTPQLTAAFRTIAQRVAMLRISK